MKERDDRMELYHCPNCGKYVSPNDPFADREDRDDELSDILPFCNEACSDAYHVKKGKHEHSQP